jgi:GMP synthase PP-ATPase subunit
MRSNLVLKRMIIGRFSIEAFEEEARKLGGSQFLAQAGSTNTTGGLSNTMECVSPK